MQAALAARRRSALSTLSSAIGNITASIYDVATGKLTSRTVDTVVYSYTYPDSTHIVKTGNSITETTTLTGAGYRSTVSQSSGLGNITSSTYDGSNRLIARTVDGVSYTTTYPDSTHVVTVGNGRTHTTVTNADGNIVTSTYDTGTGSITSTTYDGAKRLTAYTLDGVVHAVTWPSSTMMVDAVSGGATVTTTYDSAGRLVTQINS